MNGQKAQAPVVPVTLTVQQIIRRAAYCEGIRRAAYHARLEAQIRAAEEAKKG